MKEQLHIGFLDADGREVFDTAPERLPDSQADALRILSVLTDGDPAATWFLVVGDLECASAGECRAFEHEQPKHREGKHHWTIIASINEDDEVGEDVFQCLHCNAWRTIASGEVQVDENAGAWA